jgi:GNAT superfamily N-acetyltransferase
MGFVWRPAIPTDDEAIASMCIALNVDDPGLVPVSSDQVGRTLVKLREEPGRGRAVVCEMGGTIVGYALLISFWSNEFGGEVLHVDELFIDESHRGHGLATDLLERLVQETSLWFPKPVALALEVSPTNHRARMLYERFGFRGNNMAMSRRL